MKITVVGYKKEERLSQGVTNDEDTELINFLINKGLDVTPTIWNDNKVDWGSYDVAIIKSPWDYHNHLTEFLHWLDSLEKQGTKVLNPVEIIKWNSNFILKILHKRDFLSFLPDILKKESILIFIFLIGLIWIH